MKSTIQNRDFEARTGQYGDITYLRSPDNSKTLGISNDGKIFSGDEYLITISATVDIPAVTIPTGDFIITNTDLIYQAGDIPIAYGYQGHSGHMIVTPHVASGKWGITRRNPYAAPLESTAVKLYILRK